MLRTNWWLGLLAVGSLAGLNGAAQAQECTDDFDCGPGLKCGWNGGGTDTAGPSTDVGGSGAGAAEDIAAPCAPDTKGCGDPLPPDARTCVPLDRGECETAADCMDGLECQKYTYGGCDEQPTEPPLPGAEPDSDQDVADPIPEPPPCDAVPVEAKVGYCVLPVTVCNSDDDCLLGLTCVSPNSSGSSGSSGGSTGSGGATDPSQPSSGEDDLADPVPVDGGSDEKPSEIPLPEGPSTCAYVPQECEGGVACADGFTCTKVAVASWCDGGSACEPGSTDCGVPEEPECGTDYAMQCIPALDPCTTDADCDDKWVCSDFGGEEGLEAPESWGTDGKAMKACLPVGIALAANSAGGSGGDIAYPETDDSGKGVDQGTSGTGGDGTAEPHDDSTGGSSSGCSVGFGGGSLHGAWLALGLVGLVSRRRRRAA